MRNLKLCFLSLTMGFALSLLFCQASEADVEETASRFNLASELTAELFLGAYDRHGSSARISTVLDVCKEAVMANSLKVTPETVRKEASRDFKRVCRDRKYCDEQQRWMVVSSVQSMWKGYLLGYKEGAKTLLPGIRDTLCADVLKKGKAMLREKKKAEEERK